MESGTKKRFDSVTIGEEWGVADAEGFQLNETHSYEPSGYPFSICRIEDLQVAVFIGIVIPVEVRSELALRKPDWLDAMVYATSLSDPRAEVAVIEAQILGPCNAELDICAFATACVAFDSGSFNVVPKSYLVRFEAQYSIYVRMEFDDDSKSWFGEAATSSTT